MGQDSFRGMAGHYRIGIANRDRWSSLSTTRDNRGHSCQSLSSISMATTAQCSSLNKDKLHHCYSSSISQLQW